MRFLLAALFVWLAWRAVKSTPRGRALTRALSQAFAPRPSRDDPRRVLGVAPDASADEIRKAYRALAKQHHPDVVAPEAREGAEDRMLRIQRAYDALNRKGEGPPSGGA